MNKEINFDELQEVTAINPRTTYDLRYSSKTNKFNLSQGAYDRLSIAANGFRLFKASGQVILKVTANDVSTIHAGKSGDTQKGLQFTANALVDDLGIKGKDAYFVFNEHPREDGLYLSLEQINTDSQEESITSKEISHSN